MTSLLAAARIQNLMNASRLQLVFEVCYDILKKFQNASNNHDRWNLYMEFNEKFAHRYWMEFNEKERALVDETTSKMFHAL